MDTLRQQIEKLIADPRSFLSECNEQINQLVLENTKLKHRLHILNKVRNNNK